jgi:hypothetical protein
VGRCDDSRVAEIVEWIFRKFLTLVLSIVTAAIVVVVALTPVAFIRTQTHYVFLDGNLFRGHQSPPGLTATEIQKTASDSMT